MKMNIISWFAILSIACPIMLHAQPFDGRPPKDLMISDALLYHNKTVQCMSEPGFILNGWLYRLRSDDQGKLRRVHPTTAWHAMQIACPWLLCQSEESPTCIMLRPDEYWEWGG